MHNAISSAAQAARRAAAFTLVETALAVAILAVAFVPLIALLPSGMTNFRRATNQSVCTQIAQRVLADCQQMDFDLLIDERTLKNQALGPQFTFRAPSVSQPALRYFDEQGNEVVAGAGNTLSTEEQLRVVYQVNTRIQPDAGVPAPAGLNEERFYGQGYHVANITVEVAAAPPSVSIPLTNAAADGDNPRRNLFRPPAGVQVFTFTGRVGRAL